MNGRLNINGRNIKWKEFFKFFEVLKCEMINNIIVVIYVWGLF